MKPYIVTFTKIAMTAGLLYYLINEGVLDLSKLGILIDNPSALILLFLVWLVAFALLSSKRWQILLNGIGVGLSYKEAIKLQLVGLFFNVAMPGAIGGDLVKGYYVTKKAGKEKRVNAMLSIVVDRLLGLSSMFILAGLFVIPQYSKLVSTGASKELISLISGGLIFFTVFFALVISPLNAMRNGLDKVFSLKIPGMSIFKKLYDAMCLYRERPSYLFYAVGLSIIIQGSNMVGMWFVADLVTGGGVELGKVALVFPIGAVISAVPLAPGGIGVGHLAYERLFSIVGITDGANIFNLYILAMIMFNLLGGISYITNRSSIRVDEMIEEVNA
jgi:uncharacterized protein (TIRG00374 family)